MKYLIIYQNYFLRNILLIRYIKPNFLLNCMKLDHVFRRRFMFVDIKGPRFSLPRKKGWKDNHREKRAFVQLVASLLQLLYLALTPLPSHSFESSNWLYGAVVPLEFARYLEAAHPPSLFYLFLPSTSSPFYSFYVDHRIFYLEELYLRVTLRINDDSIEKILGA